MRLFDNIIFATIMSYPLFYSITYIREDIGHFFEVIFLAVLFPFLLLSYVTSFNFSSVEKISIAIISVFVIWLFSVFDASGFRPYFMLLILLITQLYCSKKYFWNNQKIWLIKSYIFVFICLSFLMSFFSFAYIDNGARFKAFSLSPTHYSVYCLLLVIFISATDLRQITKLLLYILFFGIIFYTGTRLSLAVLILLYLVYLFRNLVNRYLMMFALISFVFFAFAYPVYELINSYFSVSGMRYDGEDKSLTLRLLMQKVIVDSMLEKNIFDFIFGNGAEAARFTIEKFFDSDIQSHNDFLRLLYDFGLSGAISYISLIIYLGKRNIYSLCVLIVYFSSFYHNMVYSNYILFCLCSLFYFRPSILLGYIKSEGQRLKR